MHFYGPKGPTNETLLRLFHLLSTFTALFTAPRPPKTGPPAPRGAPLLSPGSETEPSMGRWPPAAAAGGKDRRIDVQLPPGVSFHRM